jgi:hypothetical protein
VAQPPVVRARTGRIELGILVRKFSKDPEVGVVAEFSTVAQRAGGVLLGTRLALEVAALSVLRRLGRDVDYAVDGVRSP